MTTPTTRFSDRARAYARARPGYPAAVYETIGARVHPARPRVAADVGAGTGIFSEGLLDRGWAVTAVEPNDAMRALAETRLGGRTGYQSVAGRAETTGLPDRSVSLVAAAQAFHWFDAAACAVEWRRLLAPDGLVALVWNERDVDASPFMADYEALLRRHGRDYDAVAHRRWDAEVIRDFFGPAGARAVVFPSQQRLDLDLLRDRLLSASYCPNLGEEGCGAALDDLAGLFGVHAESGYVTLTYATRLFLGTLASPTGG